DTPTTCVAASSCHVARRAGRSRAPAPTGATSSSGDEAPVLPSLQERSGVTTGAPPAALNVTGALRWEDAIRATRREHPSEVHVPPAPGAGSGQGADVLDGSSGCRAAGRRREPPRPALALAGVQRVDHRG